MPTRKPLRRMPPVQRAELRTKFQGPKNLDWLLTFVCRDIRDHLLKAFPPPDPPDVVNGLIERLGRSLCQAILDKLSRYHPGDAPRGFATLVRYYPDQTGELLNQALCYLRDIWVSDFIAFPCDTLAARAQRLAPDLSVLPPRRGHPKIGDTYYLYCLHAYEEAYQAVKSSLGTKAWKTDNPYLRNEILKERKENLARIFGDATSDELDAWARSSLSEIAYAMASKRAKELPGLTPSYLKQVILPKMRRLARAIDTALAHHPAPSS